MDSKASIVNAKDWKILIDYHLGITFSIIDDTPYFFWSILDSKGDVVKYGLGNSIRTNEVIRKSLDRFFATLPKRSTHFVELYQLAVQEKQIVSSWCSPELISGFRKLISSFKTTSKELSSWLNDYVEEKITLGELYENCLPYIISKHLEE